jgi:hypothetical protein
MPYWMVSKIEINLIIYVLKSRQNALDIA